MANNIEKNKLELFFPYYVNQSRLLDIYAILNGGYSEYSEISTAISDTKNKKGKTEISGNVGFKIFNFGVESNIAGDYEKNSEQHNEAKERKVQTVTSVLSMVQTMLKENKYLNNIQDAKPGQFVCLDVNLSINSVKSLLAESSDILKLSSSMQSLGNISKDNKKNNINTIKDVENISKAVKDLFEGEEIVYETNEYAIIGTIIDSNLYQAVRSDIVNTELKCLAQVKRIFPDGTELMKNTTFSKIKDISAKEQFISAMSGISNSNIYDFEAVAIPSIQGKPVYQLEIIALYQ